MKVGLIYTSTTPELIELVEREVKKQLGEDVEMLSMQDPSILADVRAAGYVTAAPAARLIGMYMKAVEEGVDAMLNLCSSVGEVADCAQSVAKYVGVPIVRVDEEMCRAVDFCGVRSGKDVDKAAETGLTYMNAETMKVAPAVSGAPVSLSCKVRQMLELGSHDLFIGEVTGVMVRDDLLDRNGTLHLEKAKLVAYSHGLYQKLGDVLGFFGWSVARPEVLERRMNARCSD